MENEKKGETKGTCRRLFIPRFSFFHLLSKWSIPLLWGAVFLFAPAAVQRVAMAADPLLFPALSGPEIGWGAFGVGVTFGILSLCQKRFWCRHCCPLGKFCEGCRAFSPVKARSIPFPKTLRYVGKIVALAALILTLVGGFGLLTFDSLAIYSGVFARKPVPSALLLFGTIFSSSMILPRLWCSALCPTGAMSDILFAIRSFWGNVRKARRSGGGLAIPFQRRQILILVAANIAVGILSVVGFRSIRREKRSPFRPPGSLGEELFLANCARCGRCASVCPERILIPVAEMTRLDAGTPVLDFSRGYCRDDCVACGVVCPTGAIQPFTLEEKSDVSIVSMARVEVDLENCLLWQDRECAICRARCPYEAISFVWSEEEYLSIPIIDATRCNGCGRCVADCPGVEGKKGIVFLPKKN